MSLREKLQPTITELTKLADYYSEQHIRGKCDYATYFEITLIISDIKDFIVNNERKYNEELRLSGRTDGRLHEGTYDWVEELHREQAESNRRSFFRSDS